MSENYLLTDTDLSLLCLGEGGGIPEAPADGRIYGRKNYGWVEVTGGGGDIGDLERRLSEEINTRAMEDRKLADSYAELHAQISDTKEFVAGTGITLNETSDNKLIISSTLSPQTITSAWQSPGSVYTLGNNTLIQVNANASNNVTVRLTGAYTAVPNFTVEFIDNAADATVTVYNENTEMMHGEYTTMQSGGNYQLRGFGNCWKLEEMFGGVPPVPPPPVPDGALRINGSSLMIDGKCLVIENSEPPVPTPTEDVVLGVDGKTLLINEKKLMIQNN